MILPILRWPDPRLSEVAEAAVLSDDLRALAADMLETMYAASGRGLAAPQVGRGLRIFVMDLTWKEGTRSPRVFVNPVILDASDARGLSPEGCLSIPGPTVQVERAREITLRWQDPEGATHEERLSGMAAICAQHEHDHLEGILTLDHLAPEARVQAEAEVVA